MYVCSKCRSRRLINVRHDMDWGGGDLNRLNPDNQYLTDDPKERDEYDIEFTTCLACGAYNSVNKEEE